MQNRDIAKRFEGLTDGAVAQKSDEEMVELYGLDDVDEAGMRQLAIAALRQVHWQRAHINLLRSETIRIRR